MYSLLEAKELTLDSQGFIDFDDSRNVKRLIEYADEFRMGERWNAYTSYNIEYERETHPDDTDISITNYVQTLVDKSVQYFIGKGIEAVIDDAEYQQLYEATLRESGGTNVFMKAAMAAAITGDAYIKVTWEDFSPTSWERVVEGRKGRVVIQVLDTQSVVPVFTNTGEIIAFIRLIPVGYGLTEFEYEVYERGIVRKVSSKGKELSSYEYGIPEFLIIHIPNLSQPGTFFGDSEAKRMVALSRELNDRQLDVGDIIDFHASPLIILKGVKTSQVERSPDRIWSGFPKDSDAQVLNTLSDLSGASNHVDSLKQSLAEITGIPKLAWGEIPPISNTSGAALNVLYLPLEGLRERKKAAFDTPFRKLVRLIIWIYSAQEVVDARPYKLETVYNSPIGRQRNEIVDEIIQRRKYGLISLKKSLEMLGEGEDEYNTLLSEFQMLSKEHPELFVGLFPELSKSMINYPEEFSEEEGQKIAKNLENLE